MRQEPNMKVDAYRHVPQGWYSRQGANYGAFVVKRKGKDLRVISSGSGPECEGWEHVSVSLQSRCPTWQEMCFVKSLFWEDDETVIQLHVPTDQHINQHNNCLHMWKPVDQEIPLPPSEFVGYHRAKKPTFEIGGAV